MQAIINPEKVKQFRGELVKLTDDLEKALKDTEHAIEHLSQTWKDIGFKQFHAKFDEDKKEIKPLMTKIKEFESDYLLRKQQKAEKIVSHLC